MYDLDTELKALKRMKAALDKEGLSPYLMCQPIGWRCPEVEDHPHGYLALPECPLGELKYLVVFYFALFYVKPITSCCKFRSLLTLMAIQRIGNIC